MKRLERGYKATSDDYSSDVASAYDAYTMKLSQALRDPNKGLHAGPKKESQTKQLVDRINKQVQQDIQKQESFIRRASTV